MGGFRCAVLLLLTITLPGTVQAAEPRFNGSERYTEDRVSLQVMTGPLLSSSFVGPDIPDFDYWQTKIRMGWMVSSPDGDGSTLDGGLELLLELTGSLVFDGFGDYVGGLGGIVRYNFTGLHARLVPYVQAGLALVYTDAYQDRTQKAIGQGFNFAPSAAVGIRCLLSDTWSIDVEGGYEHISNAGMDERNAGVNALGGFVGVTYFWNGP